MLSLSLMTRWLDILEIFFLIAVCRVVDLSARLAVVAGLVMLWVVGFVLILHAGADLIQLVARPDEDVMATMILLGLLLYGTSYWLGFVEIPALFQKAMGLVEGRICSPLQEARSRLYQQIDRY